MATIQITKENLDSTIEGNNILLIDFWADWCGPCKMFAPIFEKASEKYTDLAFASCNTEEQKEVAGAFNIRAIPTLAVFREQVLVFLQSGALPAEGLDQLVTQIKALDMDEVRQKIEEEKKSEENKES